jgi:ABC-type multidrug transport system fused ATPase/permease subunit
VAYVPQDPVLFPGSIRDNITFGQSFEAAWYEEVIQACALSRDLKLLPAGDETFVGDKGLVLSGGQKARVSLAR